MVRSSIQLSKGRVLRVIFVCRFWAGMARRLKHPDESSTGDAYPRHILDSINTSTDLPKKNYWHVSGARASTIQKFFVPTRLSSTMSNLRAEDHTLPYEKKTLAIGIQECLNPSSASWKLMRGVLMIKIENIYSHCSPIPYVSSFQVPVSNPTL